MNQLSVCQHFDVEAGGSNIILALIALRVII